MHENYQDDLILDLNNLLIGAKANGADKVQTKNVVRMLMSMGYSVDENSIMSVLSDNPIVMSATPDTIMLSTESGDSMDGDTGEDNAARVKDMAQNATKIG